MQKPPPPVQGSIKHPCCDVDRIAPAEGIRERSARLIQEAEARLSVSLDGRQQTSDSGLISPGRWELLRLTRASKHATAHPAAKLGWDTMRAVQRAREGVLFACR